MFFCLLQTFAQGLGLWVFLFVLSPVGLKMGCLERNPGPLISRSFPLKDKFSATLWRHSNCNGVTHKRVLIILCSQGVWHYCDVWLWGQLFLTFASLLDGVMIKQGVIFIWFVLHGSLECDGNCIFDSGWSCYFIQILLNCTWKPQKERNR